MPFGLTNAPVVFQALVNDILQDFLNQFIFVYLDDILVFSPGLATQVLLNNQLFLKAEKCDFLAPSISFLGFVVWEAPSVWTQRRSGLSGTGRVRIQEVAPALPGVCQVLPVFYQEF